MNPTNSTNPTNPTNRWRRLFIAAGAAVLACLFLYRSAVIEVILAVIDRQGSSHGVFVPFLSFFFIWTRRDALKEIGYEYNWWGIILIFLGILPILFRVGSFQICFVGYIFVLSGIVLTVLGQGIFKHIAFPLFFLISMTPLPDKLYDPLGNYSRHIAFGGALKIISFLGIPYMKDGWVIHLPNAVLRVAISCSGIRYLVSYFVFGLAYAWLYKRTLKGRLLVVALTIPVSHVASILRLTAIFTLAYTISPRMAEHWPHIFISWIVFGILLFAGITADQYLEMRKISRKSAESAVRQPVQG